MADETDPQAPAWADLQAYVGASDDDAMILESSWQTAVSAVTAYIGGSTVPVEVQHRAFLEVGSELYHRKNAPNGVAQFQTFDAAPIRVARDPLVGAYPLLSPFMALAIG